MLCAVGTTWIRVLVGFIVTVVLASVVIGLTSPDGTVGGNDEAQPTASATTDAPTPTPTPTADPKAATPSAERAPARVRGTWPGRPDATAIRGSRVDWCPAVRTTGAGEAEAVFGEAAVRSAACTAVRFMFEQHYSRLALPRHSYAAKDLDFVLPALAPATVDTYRPRISAFVACPNSLGVRNDLGLALFSGEGTPAGAKHAAAGDGRVFYGSAFDTNGYKGRAVWINPTWSKVAISVDRSKAEPRIVASLDSSAAVPVFNPETRRDEMLTAPTRATFFLRQAGKGSWKIGGWTEITNGPVEYARLKLK